MAPLFSKVDSNKLWHDVQNEETVIFAKFGKDLFNISKVICRKTKWPRFFGPPGIIVIIRASLQCSACKACISYEDKIFKNIECVFAEKNMHASRFLAEFSKNGLNVQRQQLH